MLSRFFTIRCNAASFFLIYQIDCATSVADKRILYESSKEFVDNAYLATYTRAQRTRVWLVQQSLHSLVNK
jgi:hypothetical protein